MSRSITHPTNHPSSQSLTHSITHFPLPPTMLLHSSPNQSPTPLKKWLPHPNAHPHNHPIHNNFTQPLTHPSTPPFLPWPSQSLRHCFINLATDSVTSPPSHSSTHSFFTPLTQSFFRPPIRQHTRSPPHSPPTHPPTQTYTTSVTQPHTVHSFSTLPPTPTPSLPPIHQCELHPPLSQDIIIQLSEQQHKPQYPATAHTDPPPPPTHTHTHTHIQPPKPPLLSEHIPSHHQSHPHTHTHNPLT